MMRSVGKAFWYNLRSNVNHSSRDPGKTQVSYPYPSPPMPYYKELSEYILGEGAILYLFNRSISERYSDFRRQLSLIQTSERKTSALFQSLFNLQPDSFLQSIKFSMELPSPSELALLSNVQLGAIEEVKASLKKGVNINARSVTSGDTALHFAVAEQISHLYCIDNCPYIKIAKLLLKKGADFNFPNYHGVTPLQLALLEGEIEMVHVLLSKESDYEKILKGRKRDFSLHNRIEIIIAYLLANKTFKMTASNYPILLSFVLKYGDEKTFATILENKVEININTIVPAMRSPLIHLVVKKGSLKILKHLVNHGIDIEKTDIDGKTAVHEAIKQGKMEHFLYLLECGACVSCEDFQGRTPLHTAAEHVRSENKIIEMMDLILRKGVDVNVKSQVDGKTPLHVACSQFHNLETVKFLVEKGADLYSRDRYGETPLHLAMKYNVQGHLIKYLLNLKADVNVLNGDGETPLSAAVCIYDVEDNNVNIVAAHIAKMIVSNSNVCAENLKAIKLIQ